jgi:hypothetical protein
MEGSAMAPPTRMTWLLIGGRPRRLDVEFPMADPDKDFREILA